MWNILVYIQMQGFIGKPGWAGLLPTSIAAVETLSFSYEVIIPMFPNAMLMNPLTDCENYYHKVTCAEDLRETMEKIADGHSLCNIDEYRQFVKRYWNIDSTLPRWTKLLNL